MKKIILPFLILIQVFAYSQSEKIIFEELYISEDTTSTDSFKITTYKNEISRIELNYRQKQYLKRVKIDVNKQQDTLFIVKKRDSVIIKWEFADAFVIVNILEGKKKSNLVLTSKQTLDELVKETKSYEEENIDNEKESEENENFSGTGHHEVFYTSKRKVIDKPVIYSNCSEIGIVTLLVQVDKHGSPKSSRVKQFTNSSSCLLHRATQLAKKHKWEIINVNEIQTVELMIEFK